MSPTTKMCLWTRMEYMTMNQQLKTNIQSPNQRMVLIIFHNNNNNLLIFNLVIQANTHQRKILSYEKRV